MDGAIHVEPGDGVIHIHIARPAKRNALTVAMYAVMADAMAAAEHDDSVRAVIFSGEGAHFCAGNDLADFVANPSGEQDRPVLRFIRSLANATKILVAAVQGKAVGIGTTMLLHCDFVFAEETAELRMPFVDLALVPEAGSSLLVPALVGPRVAAELLLLGAPVGAARALELGLVNRVVAPGEALGAARAVVEALRQKPAQALRATKALMKSPMRDLHGRIDEENAAFDAQLETLELRQTIAAFFQARQKPAESRGEAA